MGKLKFYRDEPLFGLDIGHATVKVMQLDLTDIQHPVVLAYGMSSFDPAAIQNGVIVKPQVLGDAMHQLFEHSLTGSISTRRVACSLPTSRTFSRIMKTPPLEHKQIVEAIQLEAEQYIPIPLANLYLDYEVISQSPEAKELSVVATPKTLVDSYMQLLQSLELEPVAFEPSINAAARLLEYEGNFKDEPAILVDIGSVTTDIALFDKTIIVSSTLNSGGDTITELISKSLHLTMEQAGNLKDTSGIAYSEKQQRIIDAIRPVLTSLVHEIEKSVRYYSERAAKSGRKISQIIVVGGGSIMPGLNHYLAKELRIPAHNLDPWPKMDFGQLPVPQTIDRSVYITAAGEAILKPEEATS